MKLSKPVDGKLALNLSLRLKYTKILLSDLLDPSVTWLRTSLEAYDLVDIRKRLDFGEPISTNVSEKVRRRHQAYFAENCAFPQASYDEALAGSIGLANRYVLDAAARWGVRVPGTCFAWLIDIHARALRAHLRTLSGNPPETRWARALDWRYPFPVFGKGSRITYPEYLELVGTYRKLKALGYPQVQPVLTPDRWHPYWRPNETEHRNDNESDSCAPAKHPNECRPGHFAG